MALRLYNTLTRQKESFVPINPDLVKMYVCGPTVYSYIHIGNARAFVFFDVVRRYLEFLGYQVKYVKNITDVDDKLLEAARETETPLNELAERYTKAFNEDMRALGVKEADVHPKATEYIEEMIALIADLIDKEYAYVSEGDVYFRSLKVPNYAELSHQSLDELRAGARVEVNNKKEHNLDFVLWKAAKQGEQSWYAPWGEGRPGWHTECTAMIRKILGDQIDIHAGGIDLCFPHHTNEAAQGEVLSNKRFVNYWLHNGFINMENEKMSKSLGNVRTVYELRQRYAPIAIRYFILSVHYRNPMQYSERIMDQAQQSVAGLRAVMQNLRHRKQMAMSGEIDSQLRKDIMGLADSFCVAMNDDLNTANAISVLFEGVKLANELIARQVVSEESLDAMINFFSRYGGEILGLVDITDITLEPKIEALVAEREHARKEKNFVKADEIRNKLLAEGIVLEDTAQGVRWQRK